RSGEGSPVNTSFLGTTPRRLVIAAVIGLALLAPALTQPASAHHGSGGPVRLYLESVRLEPNGTDWTVRTGLNDTSSGRPAPGFLVQVSGTGPDGATFGPVSLGDDDSDGRYDADLGTLAAGDWSLSVDVGDVPGGDGYLVPIHRTWPVRLQAGQALDLAGQGSPSGAGSKSSSSGGATDFAPVLLGVGLAAVAGVTGIWFTRRRRAMVPAR
ncbi:MAG TPA: hypothetical protein VHL53_13965, partial [Acidimicrobiia bacterium]|nr:hypothetical protein [Acidimicrobiia bacterium]